MDEGLIEAPKVFAYNIILAGKYCASSTMWKPYENFNKTATVYSVSSFEMMWFAGTLPR